MYFAHGEALTANSFIRKEAGESIFKNDLDITRKNKVKMDLQDHFKVISTTTDQAIAEKHVEQVLAMCQNDEVPTLFYLGIDPLGSGVYDKPTTIKHYLSYLKIKTKYSQTIRHISIDKRGLITKMTLEN